MPSLTFDHAVSFYDKTRSLPEWVSSAIIDSIIQIAGVNPASPLLEIGVGTGRIALPLLKRNLSVYGIDLSIPMMGEFQKKILRTEHRAELAQADAQQLPFPDAAFDCVYAVHVYHLVDHWRDALQEARRVLKPGGVLLSSYHRRDPQSPNRKIRRRLFELVRERGIDASRPGSQSDEELQAELEKHGATQRVRVASWHERTVPVNQIIDELQARLYSETWLIPEEVMAQVTPSLRDWAKREFGGLGYPVCEEEEFAWLVSRK